MNHSRQAKNSSGPAAIGSRTSSRDLYRLLTVGPDLKVGSPTHSPRYMGYRKTWTCRDSLTVCAGGSGERQSAVGRCKDRASTGKSNCRGSTGRERAGPMNLPEFKIDTASIVMLGTFKASTITPASLAAEGLLGKDEALSARSPFLTPDVSIFDAAWLHAEVTRNRILFSTSDTVESIRLCDLASGVLMIPTSLPVSAIGLNRNVHFQVASATEWHNIGDRLVPKTDWEGILNLPGTRSLVLMGTRSDKFAGHVQITIEPSFKLGPGIFGVYIEHNDHYVLQETTGQPSSRLDLLDPAKQAPNYVAPSPSLAPMAKDIITSRWAGSMKRAEQAVENVWKMRIG